MEVPDLGKPDTMTMVPGLVVSPDFFLNKFFIIINSQIARAIRTIRMANKVDRLWAGD